MEGIRNLMFNATYGVIQAIAMVYVLVALINFILISLGVGMDDSDKSRFKRSGLKLHTDYKTGLQYFSTKQGYLMPRLDENGKQLKE